MKHSLFLIICWSLLFLVSCDNGRNPVDGVVIYDFDFDVDQSNVTCYALCTDGETEKAVLGATSYVHSDVSYIVFDFYDLQLQI